MELFDCGICVFCCVCYDFLDCEVFFGVVCCGRDDVFEVFFDYCGCV